MAEDMRRALPSVEQLASEVEATLDPELPHALVVSAARSAIDAARATVESGGSITRDEVTARASTTARDLAASLLTPVINATGVIVHTNLGRAPVDPGALARAAEIAAGYSTLEYRLADGERGSRHEHAGDLLARAVGAEAGMVVNNNAAAVLLALAALARGREVVVSRGELVEIGGGFRIPDVMAESGARLVEVGTTNRTRLADYEAALSPSTAAVLKVHASNYRIEGFAEATPLPELASLGPPVVFDAGSGLLDERTPWLDGGAPAWLGDEPGVRQALEAGAAVVTFSGDKLLGGPQAGIVVGARDLLDRMARHPLARAVRADKLTLGALQHVALTYLDGRAGDLPLWRMATLTTDELRDRASRVAGEVPGAQIVATVAVVGGGSNPGVGIPSAGVAVAAPGRAAQDLAAGLRAGGIVARVEDDSVVLDLRTVPPEADDAVAKSLAAALEG